MVSSHNQERETTKSGQQLLSLDLIFSLWMKCFKRNRVSISCKKIKISKTFQGKNSYFIDSYVTVDVKKRVTSCIFVLLGFAVWLCKCVWAGFVSSYVYSFTLPQKWIGCVKCKRRIYKALKHLNGLTTGHRISRIWCQQHVSNQDGTGLWVPALDTL